MNSSLHRKHSLVVLVLSVLNLLSFVTSELLFCYNGPQRIKDTDCPGGFIANKPLNTSCVYYYVSDNVPEGSTAQIVENHCDSSDEIELDATGDIIKSSQLSEFFVNLGDTAADKATPGTISPEDVCADSSCLAEWKDPDEIDPEDHLEDIPPPLPDAESAIIRERRISRKIFMKLVMDDEYEEDYPDGFMNIEDPLFYELNTTQPRIIKLLAKSMQIAFVKCAPYIEETFMRQVLKAMIYLNRINKKSKMDLGMAEYEKIDGYLDNCLTGDNKVFKLHGSHCETHHKVESIEFLKKKKKEDRMWQYRIQARSFVWGLYDPVVEAAWAAVDFIHGYCFPHFIKNLNHHHMYEIAMEAVFPDIPVQRHWMTPTSFGKGEFFWNSIMESANIKIAMRNMDACAIAGYAVSPYRHRLERSFTPEVMLENPQYSPVPSGFGGGWTKSIKDYWKYYDGRGGFKRYAKDLGQCLETVDDDAKTKAVDEAKANCPSTESESDDDGGTTTVDPKDSPEAEAEAESDAKD